MHEGFLHIVFRPVPANLVAVHAATEVDSIKTIRFCISLLTPSPPPPLDLLVDQASIVALERLGWDDSTLTVAYLIRRKRQC